MQTLKYCTVRSIYCKWWSDSHVVSLIFLVYWFYYRLPWDQNCLLGWIGEEFLTTIMVAMSVIVALTFLALFISFLFFNLAFYQIYRTQFEKIDSLPQSTQFHGYVVKKLLLESISFHISAKKCVNCRFEKDWSLIKWQ